MSSGNWRPFCLGLNVLNIIRHTTRWRFIRPPCCHGCHFTVWHGRPCQGYKPHVDDKQHDEYIIVIIHKTLKRSGGQFEHPPTHSWSKCPSIVYVCELYKTNLQIPALLCYSHVIQREYWFIVTEYGSRTSSLNISTKKKIDYLNIDLPSMKFW